MVNSFSSRVCLVYCLCMGLKECGWVSLTWESDLGVFDSGRGKAYYL